MNDPGNPSAETDNIQGEGDYEAADRYREGVRDFIKSSDIEKLAENAEPQSPTEIQDLARAEKSGRSRSKGDDPADVGIMYTEPGEKTK
jgi:hypothetical protein